VFRSNDFPEKPYKVLRVACLKAEEKILEIL